MPIMRLAPFVTVCTRASVSYSLYNAEAPMDRDRLTAFTDGVLAVIITIMVLEMKPPHGASFADLLEVLPIFLSYVLSFIYIGIYWNNHHHFFRLVGMVDGAIL